MHWLHWCMIWKCTGAILFLNWPRKKILEEATRKNKRETERKNKRQKRKKKEKKEKKKVKLLPINPIIPAAAYGPTDNEPVKCAYAPLFPGLPGTVTFNKVKIDSSLDGSRIRRLACAPKCTSSGRQKADRSNTREMLYTQGKLHAFILQLAAVDRTTSLHQA